MKKDWIFQMQCATMFHIIRGKNTLVFILRTKEEENHEKEN